MSQLKTLLKFLVPLLIFSFFVYRIGKDWSEVSSTLSQINLIWFIPAVIALVPVLPFSSLAWHLVISDLGGKIPFWRNFRVWILSNAARFLPGSVWQYPSRIYLASQVGTSIAVSSTCLIIEILLQVLAGAIIIFLVIPLLPLELTITPLLSLLAIIPLLIFLFLPKVLDLIFPLLLRLYKKIKKAAVVTEPPLLKRPPWQALLATFGTFILPGASLYFLIHAFTETSFSLLTVIGIYAISWLTGYFVFIVPAGLGVADATLAALLGLFIPLPLSSLIVICFRFLLLVNELIMIATALFLSKFQVPTNT